MTPLHQLRRGETGRIATINEDDDALIADLADAGFHVGEVIELLERGAIGGTPLAVRVGRAIVAVRRREATAIMVERT
ncbi:FeoA family protein [Parvularcula sp. LCG005]|uniref:FeoA family protein n=1 Tax=Parvularcula sp. LCG005 TaxID=3078805 RepID=UPI002942C63D|nr:FeoA family protein [Parvularcula sp. LCG005]WOI52496.1 FeoA family protein [Parvularcula sp. LCG005]